MAQLTKMLQNELQTAMQETSVKSLTIMRKEISNFYTGGALPTVYRRTYALGSTPRTTKVSSVGNTALFDAYLDQTHVYSTGRDLRIMSSLLPAAEAHTHGIKGSGGFWRRSEEQIGEAITETIKNHFS